MYTYFSQSYVPARFFALLTMFSLLISALPVGFFVAQAVNTDAVGDITLAVVPSTNTGAETVTVSFSGSGTLDLTDWTIWDTLASERVIFTFGAVSLVDGESFTVCYDGTCDGQSSGGPTVWNDSGDTAVLKDESGATVLSTTWSAVTTNTQYSNSVTIDYGPVGTVRNVEDDLYFATIQDAIDAATTEDGETIELTADVIITEQIDITKELTLDGNGNTITAEFYKTDNSNNAAIGIIGTDNVTITDVTVDGALAMALQAGITMSSIPSDVALALKPNSGGVLTESDRWRLGLHGINVYESTGVEVDRVTSNNFRSGMVVNGSTVTASDFSTEGNIWHGINVSPGNGVTAPSVLNIAKTSTHAETAPVSHIFTDNIFAGPTITVNDIDDQYDVIDIPSVSAQTLVGDQPVPTARAYFLKDTVIYGCMDEAATNYDPAATEQGDVACTYPAEPVNTCVIPDYPTGPHTFTLGTSNEPDVGTIFTANGYGSLDPEAAETGIEVWNFEDNDSGSVTVTVTVLAKYAGNNQAFGYYPVGDHSDFVPLFKVGSHSSAVPALAVGDSITVTIPNLSTIGFALDTEGSQPNRWYSESALNTSSADNVAVYNPLDNTYLLAFEDLLDSDGDYNDLVLEITDVVCNPKGANLYVSKIICDDESELPNWSGTIPTVTASTATQWLAENTDSSCRLAPDWEFEWGARDAAKVANDYVGQAGADWTTFTGNTVVPLSAVNNKSFWVREVLQDDYIPFAGGRQNDVSAELYCYKDGLNYDNLDRIDRPKAGEDYYCVAWNVPIDMPDTGKPDVEIEYPADGAVLPQGLYTVTGTATDTKSDITEVKYTITEITGIGGTYVGSVASGVANGTTTWNFPFAGLDTGFYRLKVQAFDDAGNFKYRYHDVQIIERIVYAPYCGDDIKQGWEMCDGADVAEGGACTDYCTLDNQCTDLKLVKITLEDTVAQSVNFDGQLYLGNENTIIPNGTWFNFEEAGDQSFVTTANNGGADGGLAIERDQTNGTLAVAFKGGTGSRALDIVKGTIETLGIDLGTVKTNYPGFPLEFGSNYSAPDEINKNPDNSLDFEMFANSGNDAFSVVMNDGEEYNCSTCRATVEARIVLNDSGTAGDGDLSDQIILGDAGYSTVEFGEWFPVSTAANPGDSAVMISDPNTVTNFANPSSLPGLFVSREDGTIKVALYGEYEPGGNTNHEWIDARIEVRDAQITNYQELFGQFKLENHPENNGVSSNDGYDDVVADSTGVDFKLWVDTAADGFRFDIDQATIVSCKEDTVELMYIDGYKYDRGESDLPITGWTIELFEEGEGPLVAATTTDASGYYYFEVPVGDYDVYEQMQFGWVQEDVQANGTSVFGDSDDQEYSEDLYCEFDYNPHIVDQQFQCDFYNVQLLEQTFRIFGTKYEYQQPEQPIVASGWTIYASNGIDEPRSTTTDSNGGYYFDVPAGDWIVYEEDREGWELVEIEQFPPRLDQVEQEPSQCELTVGSSNNDPGLVFSVSDLLIASSPESDYSYECYFYNKFVGTDGEEEPEDTDQQTSSSRSSGTRLLTQATPVPLVLGVSTGDQCPFLVDYMQMGDANDPLEVMKLQLFLNIFKDLFGGTTNPVTGTFGVTTDANVKAFQDYYRSDILDPWFELGIVPHSRPTGFVYKTTLWKINSIVCPESAIAPVLAGETLQSNVDIDVAPIQD